MEKDNRTTETPAELEKVIARILELDMSARNITDEALEKKSEAEKDVVVKKDEMRSGYLERAKAYIEKMKTNEQDIVKGEIEANEKQLEGELAALEEKYKAGCDTWVSEIFKEVTRI